MSQLPELFMRPIAPVIAPKGFFKLKSQAVGTPDRKAADGYLERVRAYVPLEVIALFVFVNSLVIGQELTSTHLIPGKGSVERLTADGWVAVALLFVGAVAAAISAKIANRDGVWLVQSVLSALAFLIWTYAMNARGYEVLAWPVVPSVVGLLLGGFTLFSGLVVPVGKVPPPTG